MIRFDPDRGRRAAAWAGWYSILLFLLSASLHAAERRVLAGHVPAVVTRLPAGERLPPERRLNLAIGLPLRNQAELSALLTQLRDPASPNYRQWLTPEEFTERFGPTEADYAAIASWARTHGLKVAVAHPNRVVLDVEGSVAAIETALHLTLRLYHHPSEARTFYSPDQEPSLDLAAPILHISGLDNYALPHPMHHVQSLGASKGKAITPRNGSGPSGTYLGSDFRAAYVPGTLLTGAGQSIGLLEFDGYYASDITNYESLASLPNVPLIEVPINGGVSAPGGGNAEVCLDIEMALSMAPGLSGVYVYEAPNPSPWVDLLNRMANDNLSSQLSCSWGGGGPDATAEGIFQQMAVQGQSFFNASGDSDAFTTDVEFPSDSPGITQVGGTTLTTSGPGGSYVSETVWNWGGGVGSSGGISTFYSLPDYQEDLSMTENLGSTTMRNIPDVALTADNVYVLYNNGSAGGFGGTSCAAPLWAGVMALANQQAVDNGRPTAGFINDAVYALGKGAGYAGAFHDITAGDNTWSGSPSLFFAVPGYDLCTGWGTPTGTGLIDALVGPPDLLQIRPLTGFSSSGGAGGPFDVTAQDFTLTNLGATALNWTVVTTSVWLEVSSVIGTLTAGGATTTVTVSLNAAASNLVAGSYVATAAWTNLSSGVGQSRAFTLTVLSAPLITSQPASQTVLEGGTASLKIGAIGLPPLYYQWRRDGTNLPGATDQTLTLTGVTTNQGGNYSAVVTNSLGSTNSGSALLTVIPFAPNDQCGGAIIISANNYRNFQTTTKATSTNDPSPGCVAGFGNGVWYQFTAPSDGVMVVDTIGSDFDTGLGVYTGTCGDLTEVGCDDDFAHLLISRVTITAAAGATYYILAGGYFGQTGNLVFDLAFTSLSGPPVIVAQPGNQDVVAAGEATFNISAAGGAPLSYFWERNGQFIAGATGTNYSTNNVQFGDSGSQFSCLVSNSLGTVLSSNALLSVLSAPVDHFAWSAVASPQSFGHAFAVTVIAKDAGDSTIAGYAGMVNLSGWRPGENVTLEDFEAGVWPQVPWVSVMPDIPGTAGTAYAHDGGLGLHDPEWTYRTDEPLGNIGDTLSWWIRPSTAFVGRAYLGFGASAAGCWSIVAAPNTGELLIQHNAGFTNFDVAASTSQPWRAKAWYRIVLSFVSTSEVTCNLYDSDGANLLNSLSCSGITGLPGGVAIRSFSDFSLDTIVIGGSSSEPVPIAPATSGNFVSGVWTGSVAVFQVTTNVLLRAVDGAGHNGASNPFEVVAPSIQIHNISWTEHGVVQMDISGLAGDVYRILASSNLLDWQTIATVSNLTGVVQFTDSSATNDMRRFYRCVMP